LLAQDFHVDPTTISPGMRELEKYGVLEIKRARIPKGAGYEDRDPNQYLLGMLYSEKDMEEKWLGMEKLYGKDKVAKAREFGFMIYTVLCQKIFSFTIIFKIVVYVTFEFS